MGPLLARKKHARIPLPGMRHREPAHRSAPQGLEAMGAVFEVAKGSLKDGFPTG